MYASLLWKVMYSKSQLVFHSFLKPQSCYQHHKSCEPSVVKPTDQTSLKQFLRATEIWCVQVYLDKMHSCDFAKKESYHRDEHSCYHWSLLCSLKKLYFLLLSTGVNALFNGLCGQQWLSLVNVAISLVDVQPLGDSYNYVDELWLEQEHESFTCTNTSSIRSVYQSCLFRLTACHTAALRRNWSNWH